MARLEEIGGFTFHEVPDDVFTAFEEAIQPVEADWIARAQDEGVDDPKALLDAFREELRASNGS